MIAFIFLQSDCGVPGKVMLRAEAHQIDVFVIRGELLDS